MKNSSSKPEKLITSSVGSGNNINLDNCPIIFDSLEVGYNQIKLSFLGVGGVYMLINKKDPQRGSSVNLARRTQEYIHLIKGIRQPNSISQEEIKKTAASNWILIILVICTPQLSLVHEQLALIIWKPTINRYFSVVPRINPQWSDIDTAIIHIKEFLFLFEQDSFGFNRFQKFLTAYTIAKELKSDPKFLQEKHFSNLVFVYNKRFPEKDPIVYSSINKALKSLLISHSTLMDCVINQYILRDNLVLSFEPFTQESLVLFTNKPIADNQLRKEVIVFNEENELAYVFKSGREMARHLKIDGKVARAAILEGTYQNFTLIAKAISNRQEVLVLSSETFELVTELKSITVAMKYAKVNFYTMKILLETNKPHFGKIFKYKNTHK